MKQFLIQYLNPTWIIFIGVMVAGFGGVLASWEQDNSNKEIVSLTKEIAGNVTGGDGYCFVRVDPSGGLGISLLNSSRFPLYDIRIETVDLNALDKIKNDLSPDLEKARKRFELDVLPKESLRILAQQAPLTADSLRWNIFIRARNGAYVQQLRIIKNDEGKYAIAIRLKKPVENKYEVFFEEIAPNFPKGPDGTVVWD